MVDFVPERHVESPPLLVAEVLSASTAEKDRTVKFDLYQQQGVSVYLVLDPDKKTVEAFELSEGQYLPIQTDDGIQFCLQGVQIAIPLAAIFQ